MAHIRKFEEIEAWRNARIQNKEIYAISNSGLFAKDFGLRNQIQRASVSVMSNIAEGLGRGGNKEFAQFLSNAKASNLEVQTQLYVALDAGYIDEEQFEELYSNAEVISAQLGKFISYLSNSSLKGSKFKASNPPSRKNICEP